MSSLTYSLFFAILVQVSRAGIDHAVYWNASNSLFRESMVPEMNVSMGDVLRMICPPKNSGINLVVYEVGELAFGDCQLESASREVLRCGRSMDRASRHPLDRQTTTADDDLPKQVVHTIRRFNPVPNGKEYEVGQSYFFITTSNGRADGMNLRSMGLCRSKNMRVKINILPSSTQQQDSADPSSSNHLNRYNPITTDVPVVPRLRPTTADDRLHEYAQAAGVHQAQLEKVAQMAQEGRTGSFQNSVDRSTKSAEHSEWDPVPVQFVSDLIHKTYQAVDGQVSYLRATDYEIHDRDEKNDSVRRSSLLFFVCAVIYLLR